MSSDVTYTPNADFNGSDSFAYTVSDGNGGTDTATVNVTVDAANDAPVANDDSASTSEDTALNINVLANDTDVDGDSLTVQSVTQGTNGSVFNNGTNVTYSPNPDFNGGDSFAYTVADGNGGTNSATVTVVVTAVNDAPVASDDPASTSEDTALNIDVLANDTDVDGNSLTVQSVTQGTNGTVTNNGIDVTYTPNADFNGSDSFAYTVSDGNGGTDTAAVNVTVNATDDDPVANDDSVSTSEDTAVNIDVLANDSDVDGDTLSVSAVTQGTNGTVTNNGIDVTYTPDPGFTGVDSFDYTADDGNGGSDTATVTVAVEEGGPKLSIGVVQNVDNTAWTTVILARSYNDMVVVCSPSYDNALPPMVVRVRNASGDTFEMRVQRVDGSAAASPAIDVHYMVVEAGVYTAAEDGVKMEADKYLSTVTDENNSWNGQARTYSNSYTSPVVFGQVMTDNDPNYSVFWCRGSSRQSPPSSSALFTGKTVNEDSNTARADETIGYIIIEAGNGTLNGASYTAALGSDIILGMTNSPPYTYSLTGLSDATVAVATQAAMDGGNGGWALLYGANPVTATSLNLAIDEDQLVDSERNHTSEQVGYIVFDKANEPPTAVDDSDTVAEGGTLNVTAPGVLANDSDPDGHPLTVNTTPVVAPPNGSLTLYANGAYDYTHDGSETSSDSVVYEISDGSGGTDTAIVNLTITAANDDPIAVNDSGTVAEGGTLNVAAPGVLANDSDPDGDPLTVNTTPVVAPANGSLTLYANGAYDYTHDDSETSSDSFVYEVSDGNGGTDTANVSVTINPMQDPPTASDDSASTVENTAVNIDVLGNDSDPDGDVLTISAVTQGANGTVTNNGTDVTYAPDTGFNGADSFTYTADDGNGGTDTANVNVTINEVNDPPTAVDDAAVTDEDTAVIIGVLANDTDPENDPLTVSAVTQGTNGTVTNNGTDVTYTPNADFNGSDSFTYTVSDGNGGTDTANVNVTVTPVNDPPGAVADFATTDLDTPATISVLANDTDIDGDTLSVSAVTQGANGTVTNNGTDVTYTPNPGFNGNDSFTYTVSDGNGGTDTATVDVTVNQSAPDIYFSFTGTATVPGVGTVRDEDIVTYDVVTDTWAMLFDGSDVGVTTDINALHVRADGSILMSFNTGTNVSGVGTVDDSDIVRFIPTSTGPDTSGTFEHYFDGSDVGLTSSGEDIDGLYETADGRVFVSTTGSLSGSGASGRDEDVFEFTPTNLGSTTAGSFALYFDGSDVGFSSSSEDLNAVTFEQDDGDLLFSTTGSYSAAGGSGNDEDVSRFTGTYGSSTSGSAALELDLSALGIDPSEDLDGLCVR